MSAGTGVELFEHEDTEETNRCAVVSIYEDGGGRNLLMRLCNSLSWKFKDDLEFHFDWWRFKFLADPEIGMEAAHSAAHADLILLAPKSPDLPGYVQGWFEDWLPSRATDDGALVLVRSSPKGKAQPAGLRSFLRKTAKRAHLDYLSLDTSGPRADFVLSQPDLSDLLYETGQPHWGINE